jgi:hypothetical protein
MVKFDKMYVFKKLKPIKVVSTAWLVWTVLSCASCSVSMWNNRLLNMWFRRRLRVSVWNWLDYLQEFYYISKIHSTVSSHVRLGSRNISVSTVTEVDDRVLIPTVANIFIFATPSRPAVGPISLLSCVPFHGSRGAGAWSWPLTSI